LVLDGGDGTFSQPGPGGGDSLVFVESGEVSMDDIFGGNSSTSVHGTEFFVGKVSEKVETEGGGVTSGVPGLNISVVHGEDAESGGFFFSGRVFLVVLDLPGVPEVVEVGVVGTDGSDKEKGDDSSHFVVYR